MNDEEQSVLKAALTAVPFADPESKAEVEPMSEVRQLLITLLLLCSVKKVVHVGEVPDGMLEVLWARATEARQRATKAVFIVDILDQM